MRWGSRVFASIVAAYTLAVGGVLAVEVTDRGFIISDMYFLPVLAGTVIGVFLTFKRPDNRMGPLLVALVASLTTLGLSNVFIEDAMEMGDHLRAVIATHLSDIVWVAQSVIAFVLLPLWFPTGRAPNRGWAWVGRLAIAGAFVVMASGIFAETVCVFDATSSDECSVIPNPWGIRGYDGPELLFLLPILMAVPAVASVFVRWRRSDDLERRQIKWFFVAVVGLLIGLFTALADINDVLNEVPLAAALTGVWLAIAVAVLRYRLYEIDRILSRTVSYALVIAVLAGVYTLLVTAISLQFEGSLAVAASTLTVAVLFNPLRRRVQDWVDRRFNRTAYDTAQVLDGFAGSLRDQIDGEALVDGWLDVVSETMQPSAVGVWVR